MIYKGYIIVFFLQLSLVRLKAEDRIGITSELYLTKLNENVYIHTSQFEDSKWGKFWSNGLIIVNDTNAILLDTPMENSLTKTLVEFVEHFFEVKFRYFVPNHWHRDCTGGYETVILRKMITILNSKSDKILLEKGIDFKHSENEMSSKVLFDDFQEIIDSSDNSTVIINYYPGEAHSSDNIVTYIPKYKILFGGCMVKSVQSKSMGNLSDANIKQWDRTLENVLKKFPEVEIVVPGHGNYGNKELIDYTINLIEKKRSSEN